MKVITVGRSSKNEQVIHDTAVSRHHCQFIQDDNGRFRLADFGSRNGTYVNGKKIKGEVALKPGYKVKIGKTVVPWEKYFDPPEVELPPPPLPPPPTTNLGILVFALGLVSAGIILYIVGKFYTDPGVNLVGAANATRHFFPLYLKNVMFAHTIVAIVFAAATGIVAEVFIETKDNLAKTGEVFASLAGSAAGIFLLVALFIQ